MKNKIKVIGINIVVIMFLLSFSTFGQEYKICTEAEMPVQWKAKSDFYEKPNIHERNLKMVANYNPAKMKPQLIKALEWVKSKAEGIGGYQAEYYYNYIYGSPDPEILQENRWFQDTKILGYFFLRIYAEARVCKTVNGKLESTYLDGPATINMYFNKTMYHAKPIEVVIASEAKQYFINGKAVYSQLPHLKTVGRVDFYDYPGPPPTSTSRFSNIYFTNTYIIRNSDKPVFIPFTRKEYLEQYLIDMEKEFKQSVNNSLESTNVKTPEQIDQELQDRINEIKRLTENGAYGYNKESLEFRIEKAKEFYKNLQIEEAGKLQNKLGQKEIDFRESIELVKNYLKQPDSVLNKTVKTDVVAIHIKPDGIKRMLSDFDKDSWLGSMELAYVNGDYFNKNLPPDVPQFICIEFINLDNMHEHFPKIIANINKDFDFTELMPDSF